MTPNLCDPRASIQDPLSPPPPPQDPLRRPPYSLRQFYNKSNQRPLSKFINDRCDLLRIELEKDAKNRQFGEKTAPIWRKIVQLGELRLIHPLESAMMGQAQLILDQTLESVRTPKNYVKSISRNIFSHFELSYRNCKFGWLWPAHVRGGCAKHESRPATSSETNPPCETPHN